MYLLVVDIIWSTFLLDFVPGLCVPIDFVPGLCVCIDSVPGLCVEVQSLGREKRLCWVKKSLKNYQPLLIEQ